MWSDFYLVDHTKKIILKVYQNYTQLSMSQLF